MFSVNDSISYSKAAVVGGISVAWQAIDPSSVWGGLAAVVSGIAGSLFLSFCAQEAGDRYDKISHRVAKAMVVDSTSLPFKVAFSTAVERIQKYSHYEFFNRDLKENNAPQFFEKMISYGYCQGFTISLLRIYNLSFKGFG